MEIARKDAETPRRSRERLEIEKVCLAAKIPAIEGCYALMSTPEQALDELGQVFGMISAEYRKKGASLPGEIIAKDRDILLGTGKVSLKAPYLQAIFAVLNASPSGRPSIFYIAHVAWRHRHAQSLAMPPRAIQRVIFPLVLFVGRVLGKYRGSSWPGSPESCPGGPLVDAGAWRGRHY